MGICQNKDKLDKQLILIPQKYKKAFERLNSDECAGLLYRFIMRSGQLYGFLILRQLSTELKNLNYEQGKKLIQNKVEKFKKKINKLQQRLLQINKQLTEKFIKKATKLQPQAQYEDKSMQEQQESNEEGKGQESKVQTNGCQRKEEQKESMREDSINLSKESKNSEEMQEDEVYGTMLNTSYKESFQPLQLKQQRDSHQIAGNMLQKLKDQNSALQEENKTLQSNIHNMQAKIDNMQAQSNNYIEKINKLERQIKKQKLQNNSLRQKLAEIKNKQDTNCSSLSKQTEQRSTSYGEIQMADVSHNINSNAEIVSLFYSSDIIPTYKNYTKSINLRNIIKNIFSNRKKIILQTKLLYSYDPITPNSCTKYIKQNKHLLLLIGLGDYVIGAYTQQGFCNEKENSTFLFSISGEEKVVILQESKKGNFAQLESYIKFGNNELSLKCMTRKCTSALGLFNKVYQEKENAASSKSFFGIEEKEFQVDAYQIHQLTLG